MKSSRLATLIAISVFLLVVARATDAQSPSASSVRAQPDQMIKDLLGEVHQLRVAMQQMSVNAYRGQIMVERLRLQQEQVSRLARDLESIRSEIADLKVQHAIGKERLDEAENRFDRGLISDVQLSDIRTGMTQVKRREQVLSERETQVSAELDQERANLADLNKRLDALEREIVTTGLVDDRRANPK